MMVMTNRIVADVRVADVDRVAVGGGERRSTVGSWPDNSGIVITGGSLTATRLTVSLLRDSGRVCGAGVAEAKVVDGDPNVGGPVALEIIRRESHAVQGGVDVGDRAR